MKNLVRISPLFLATLLTSCATEPESAIPPTRETPPRQAAQYQLQQVREAYDAGRYGEVIRTVSTSEDLNTAQAAVRIEALKLQAFSYCTSNYRQLCQDAFSRILAIDSSFDLTAAERGHPVWGPAFRDAKAALKR
jgi:hypothetical protein